MVDRLSRRNKAGIERSRLLLLVKDFLTLLDEAIDCRAGLSLKGYARFQDQR